MTNYPTIAFAMPQREFEALLDTLRRDAMTACTEPPGEEMVLDGETSTAHDIMIDQTGQCPWCGATD